MCLRRNILPACAYERARRVYGCQRRMLFRNKHRAFVTKGWPPSSQKLKRCATVAAQKQTALVAFSAYNAKRDVRFLELALQPSPLSLCVRQMSFRAWNKHFLWGGRQRNTPAVEHTKSPLQAWSCSHSGLEGTCMRVVGMEIPEKVAFSVVAFPNIKLLHVPLLARRVGL